VTPLIVMLEPGDVLFVPRHWWHYVESLDTSISINTWIELVRGQCISRPCKPLTAMLSQTSANEAGM